MKRTMIRTTCAVACLCGTAMLLTGCESDEAATTSTQAAMLDADSGVVSMGMINETCPVMDGHGVDPDVYVVEAGHKIGLCCAGCEGAWNAKSADEKASYIAAHVK